MAEKDGNNWLIACLGNPGKEYEHTRHNAGFDAADIIASEINANFWKVECGAMVAHKEWHGLDIAIAKPQSFMNLSGSPVSQLMKKYDIPKERVVVIHDDMDIPEGTIRIKFQTGHGGHNGVRSIIDKVQSKSFYQVKIGVGKPPGRMDPADYVLNVPRGDAKIDLDAAIVLAAEAVLFFLENGIAKTQNRYN